MQLRKVAQTLEVGRAQGLHVAQDQSGDIVATRQFDLRTGLARVHVENHFSQRHQHGTDVWGQDLAGAHVGDVAALALVKSDQHHAFFDHITHRQTGAVAVAPGRAFDRAQQGLRFDLGQMPQVVFEHALLDGHLGAAVQVLHLAAAASTSMQAEIFATGPHTLRRFVVDRGDHAGFPVVFLAVHAGADHLERQSTFDEHHLAIGAVGNALRFDVQGLHAEGVLWKHVAHEMPFNAWAKTPRGQPAYLGGAPQSASERCRCRCCPWSRCADLGERFGPL